MTLISKKDYIQEDFENLVYELDKTNYITEFIARKVRQKREGLGLTQVDLALFLGISRTSMINIEAGKHRLSCSNVWMLCCAFSCTPNDLYPPTKNASISEESEFEYTKVVKIKARKIQF